MITARELIKTLNMNGIASDRAQAVAVTDKTFRVSDASMDGDLAVKIVSKNSGRGTRGIMEAFRLKDKLSGFVQPVCEVIHARDSIVAVLPWICAETLQYHNRQLMPKFFGSLRRWHNSNIRSAGCYSPYTNTEYQTIDAFLKAEMQLHLANAGLLKMMTVFMSAVTPLHRGSITLIHGDVHPGNISHHNGAFVLLDPEYLHYSIDWLDLDYIDLHPSTETHWWNIIEYSEECIASYFASNPVEGADLESIFRALGVLSLARGVSNSIIYGTGNTEQAIRKLRERL